MNDYSQVITVKTEPETAATFQWSNDAWAVISYLWLCYIHHCKRISRSSRKGHTMQLD